jgi:hypothetical protein
VPSQKRGKNQWQGQYLEPGYLNTSYTSLDGRMFAAGIFE